MKSTKNTLLIALASLTLAMTACDKKSDDTVKPVEEAPAQASDSMAEQAQTEEKTSTEQANDTATQVPTEDKDLTEQTDSTATQAPTEDKASVDPTPANENAQVNENKETNADNKGIVEDDTVASQNDDDLLAEMEKEALELADDVK